MTRKSNTIIKIPSGVEVDIVDSQVTVKGDKGTISYTLHPLVSVSRDKDSLLQFSAEPESRRGNTMIGTDRANVRNLVLGVSTGFNKKLQIVGVGFRAEVKNKVLHLNIGFSHPVIFSPPDGITITVPAPTEVIISGVDKQKVGQAAANIRGYRPPEPYKGKGIRYADEIVVKKEAKKKG